MDELYLLTRHGGGFEYESIRRMPVRTRRYFINKRHKEAEDEKRRMQEATK